MKKARNFQSLPVEKLWEKDDDQVLAFKRGEYVFVFNFNPYKSFSDYGILAPAGEYKVVLSTDNPDFGGYGNIDENPTQFGITPVLVDSKTVEFSVNASIFERLRSSMVNVQGGTYGTTNYKFYYKSTEDIYSAFIGGFGQAVTGNEYIFLLMSDGTLQYKALFNKNTDSKGNRYFTTDITEGAYLNGFSTLSDVKNGVKLVHASKSLPQYTESGTTLLYVDEDSFYDLELYFVK